MRILLVTPETKRGGGEKIVVALHKGYLDRGLASLLVSITGSCSGIPSSESLGGKGPKDMFVAGKLRQLIKDWHPVWVHAHMSPAQVLVVLATSGLPYNLITTEHSTSNKRRSIPGGRTFDRWLFGHFDKICCISDAVADSFSKWLPVYKSRVRCIHNGVELRRIRSLEEPPKTLRLVSVGRLEKVKNLSVALKALSLCCNDVSFSYTVFGEGCLRQKLENEVSELGLAGRVFLPGWSDHLDQELCEYSLLLVPSLWEGFGLVAVEAMAAGLPVLCSDVPGLSDVVGAAGGRRFKHDSPEELSRLIRIFANMEPHIAREHRRAARLRAAEFSIDRTIDGYITEYRSYVFAK